MRRTLSRLVMTGALIVGGVAAVAATPAVAAPSSPAAVAATTATPMSVTPPYWVYSGRYPTYSLCMSEGALIVRNTAWKSYKCEYYTPLPPNHYALYLKG